MEKQTIGVQLIAQERQKQIDKHGFTAQHSVEHPEYYGNNQLEAAALGLLETPYKAIVYTETPNNWDQEWYLKLLKKASNDRKERLIMAGALIAAELDRIQELLNNNQNS